MAGVKRVKFGIQGLDKALNGGIPERNIVLLAGGAGTGKSTLCLEFIYNGAALFGEKGLYVSTEQTREELLRVAQNFGWDFDKFEKQNLLKIVYFDVTRGDNFLKQISELYTKFTPKRIAIDSLSTLTDSLLVSELKDNKGFSLVNIAESVSPIVKTERIISKTLLYHLISTLKSFNTTTLLTSELPEQTDYLSADGVSEFICDGAMIFKSMSIGNSMNRTLEIKKMRYTPISGGIMPYSIDSKGIIVE